MVSLCLFLQKGVCVLPYSVHYYHVCLDREIRRIIEKQSEQDAYRDAATALKKQRYGAINTILENVLTQDF